MEQARNPAVGDDPDPWTVIQTVIAAVAMFAQLVCLARDAPQRPAPAVPHLGDVFTQLRDAIEDAIRHVERLIRLLGRSQSPDTLTGPFRFGVGSALFQRDQFEDYKRLLSATALDVSKIGMWTLTLIQNDAPLATELGRRMGNVQGRINALHREPSMTNEAVLEECLMMLREFHAMLNSLERGQN